MTEVEKQLRDYNWIKRNIEEARKQVEVIKDTIEAIRGLSAVSYSDMPKAKVISSVVESAIDRIEQEYINLRSWNDKLKGYCDQEMQIMEWLDCLPDNQRQVVEYRAIKNMSWHMVKRLANYSECHAKRLYYEALNFLNDK